jgi:hypothetical protein
MTKEDLSVGLFFFYNMAATVGTPNSDTVFFHIVPFFYANS